MKEPPRILEVNENSNLLQDVYMAGNPEPILYAKWSHLHPEWSRMPPSVQLLRFLYVSKYKLSNIDGSYCGRTLEIKVKNRIGEVRTSSTVTVLCKCFYAFHTVFIMPRTQEIIINFCLSHDYYVFALLIGLSYLEGKRQSKTAWFAITRSVIVTLVERKLLVCGLFLEQGLKLHMAYFKQMIVWSIE